MSDYLVEARPTLTRWLAGERIGPLPMRGVDQEPPELSFEFFPPRTEALEQQLLNSNYGPAFGGWRPSHLASFPSLMELSLIHISEPTRH